MTRTFFDQSLAKLSCELAEMGRKVDNILERTIKAFCEHDEALAQDIHDHDKQINAIQHSLEQNCMYLISRQQPIASDLRFISAAFKITSDLERIADQCADIGEMIARNHGGFSPSLPTKKIHAMFESARSMLVKALDALSTDDLVMAQEVIESDDVVDEMFSNLIAELSAGMAKNPQNAMQAVDLLLVVKYVERIGDHATNIAEWTIAKLTGTHPDMK